jgi:hypothetical protein
MRMRTSVPTLAAVGLLLLGSLAGTADAQTKSCVRNCVTPYANEPASARREVKPKCRAACKATSSLRKACLNEVAPIFKNATKTCAESLKRIKRGQPPLSVSIHLGDNYDGSVVDQVATFNYEQGCKKVVKQLWNDAKVRWGGGGGGQESFKLIGRSIDRLIDQSIV